MVLLKNSLIRPPAEALEIANLFSGAVDALMDGDRHRAAPLLGDRERTTPLSDMKPYLRACDKTPRDIASDQSLKAALE